MFVGEAKAACDAKNVALIGMCPWGMVEGRQALWEEEADMRLAPMAEKSIVENFGDYEKQFRVRKPPMVRSAALNREHSHFFLIDDGSEGRFGGETASRMAFEMAVQYQSSVGLAGHSVRDETSKLLLEQELGWQVPRCVCVSV